MSNLQGNFKMGLFDRFFNKQEEEEVVVEVKKYNGNFFNVARSGSLADIKNAIKEGANITDKNDEWCTPLMFAAEENKDPEVIKELIKAGAILEFKTKGGATPLMGAAQKNSNPEHCQNIPVILP